MRIHGGRSCPGAPSPNLESVQHHPFVLSQEIPFLLNNVRSHNKGQSIIRRSNLKEELKSRIIKPDPNLFGPSQTHMQSLSIRRSLPCIDVDVFRKAWELIVSK